MSSHQEIFEGKAPEQRRKRLHKERSHYKKKQKIQYIAGINLLGGQHISIKRHELGRIDQICVHCGAKFWIDERNHRSNQLLLYAVLVVKSFYHLCLNHHHIC